MKKFDFDTLRPLCKRIFGHWRKVAKTNTNMYYSVQIQKQINAGNKSNCNYKKLTALKLNHSLRKLQQSSIKDAVVVTLSSVK